MGESSLETADYSRAFSSCDISGRNRKRFPFGFVAPIIRKSRCILQVATLFPFRTSGWSTVTCVSSNFGKLDHIGVLSLLLFIFTVRCFFLCRQGNINITNASILQFVLLVYTKYSVLFQFIIVIREEHTKYENMDGFFKK